MGKSESSSTRPKYVAAYNRSHGPGYDTWMDCRAERGIKVATVCVGTSGRCQFVEFHVERSRASIGPIFMSERRTPSAMGVMPP